MNVVVIKKTKDLSRLSLAEVMSVTKACDIDDKQREINHVNSYSTANLGVSSNNALSFFMTPSGQAFAVQQPQIQTFNAASSIPYHQTPNVPFSIPQTGSAPNVSAKASSSNSKEYDENLALATGLVNCYNAFIAGDLP